MGGIYYYIPGKHNCNDKIIADFGLGYAREKGGPEHAPMDKGPDNGSGVTFTFSDKENDHPPLSAVYKKNFHWEQIPKSIVWIGFDPEDPPKPEDLERETIIPGFPTSMGDGNNWKIPVIRSMDDETSLPRTTKWLGGDKWGRVIKPEYKNMWDAGGSLWEKLITAFKESENEGKTKELPDVSEECGMLATAMSYLYRAGPAEFSMLNLFDDEFQVLAILRLIDWPGYDAIKKKADSEEQALTAGGEKDPSMEQSSIPVSESS